MALCYLHFTKLKIKMKEIFQQIYRYGPCNKIIK